MTGWLVITVSGNGLIPSSPQTIMTCTINNLVAGDLRCNRAHDGLIKWNHFPRCWPFVWGIRRSPGNSPHKGQQCGALMFSLTCTWKNAWANNCEAGDLRHPLWHHSNVIWCCCYDHSFFYPSPKIPTYTMFQCSHTYIMIRKITCHPEEKI